MTAIKIQSNFPFQQLNLALDATQNVLVIIVKRISGLDITKFLKHTFDLWHHELKKVRIGNGAQQINPSLIDELLQPKHWQTVIINEKALSILCIFIKQSADESNWLIYSHPELIINYKKQRIIITFQGDDYSLNT